MGKKETYCFYLLLLRINAKLLKEFFFWLRKIKIKRRNSDIKEKKNNNLIYFKKINKKKIDFRSLEKLFFFISEVILINF